MITLNKIGDYHNRQLLEIECLKADEKPIGTIDGLVITNGSKLHELDGDAYEYDEQNKTWVLQPKSSGGADGREIELQKTQTHIQWRYAGTEEWFDLVSLDEISFKHSDFTPEQLQALKGVKGDKGDPGTNGTNGKDGLSIKSTQINDSGHLILTFSDESTKDVGKVTGENGESAYQIAIRLGFRGTEQEWIESLEYDHSEEFTKLAEEVRNTASGIVADRQQITQNKTDVTQLKEALGELEECTYIENEECFHEDITDNFTIDGFIENGNSIRKGTGFSTDFIPTKIGDIFVYKLMEDFNSTYSVNLYDGSRQFIKGVKISTIDTSYKQIIGEYTVVEGSFIRFSTVSNNKESSLLYKKQKNNSKSFSKYKDTIGKIEETNADITEDVLKNKILDKYIDTDGTDCDYPNQNYYITDFIPVNEGEQYSYITRALYKNPSCVVYDRYKNFLEKYGQLDGINKETIVIPPMGHYMRFNVMNDTQNIFTVTTKKIKSIPEIISEKSVTIPSDYQELNVKISPGYLTKTNNTIDESTEYVHTDYISITDYDWFNANIHYGWNAVGYIILDDKKNNIVCFRSKYTSNGKSYFKNTRYYIKIFNC